MAAQSGSSVRKFGDWEKARRVLPGFDQFYKEVEIEAVKKEAEYFRRMVLRAFKTSGGSNGKTWAPNSDFTKRAKGSSKPLVNTGDLMGSVTIVDAGPGEFFVGVPNNARSKNGGKLVSIGAVHEFGKVIVMQITKKQHSAFMAKLKQLGMSSGRRGGGGKGKFRPGATLVIKIPKRSFLNDTKEAHFKPNQTQGRVKRRLAANMRSRVGSLNKQI